MTGAAEVVEASARTIVARRVEASMTRICQEDWFEVRRLKEMEGMKEA